MGLEQATAREIVEKAVGHKWGIPEFQRGFVWTPQKVRDLADSLWRGYPVGSYLVWYSQDDVEPKVHEDQASPGAWLVDGQQRTTALCILLGRKPYWWEGQWNETIGRHDIRFDVLAEDEPFFSLRTAAMKGAAARRWVSVREVLDADDDQLAEAINKLLGDLELPAGKFGTLWTRLSRVRGIGESQIPVMTVMLDLEDVTEIFARLNSAGTKVTEADIALALAASQNPGWAREEFLPFLGSLRDAGFDIDPNLVFRSAVAIGLGQARLKDVPKSYWAGDQLAGAWIKTKVAWQRVVKYVEDRGILSSDVLPTKNALIPLTVLVDRFPGVLSDGKPLAWLLHATRSGRYGGSAITALDKDVKAIRDSASPADALAQMTSQMEPWAPFEGADFFVDYRDRFLRLVMYLIAWDREARDWVSKQRLGFQGAEVLERFDPDWHHIFPRAYLRDEGVAEDEWNRFANVAVVDGETNRGFSAKPPTTYLDHYKVDNQLLEEQLVPTDRGLLTIERYPEFLQIRAASLAVAANDYYGRLSMREEQET
jgi:hypothetical protein